MFAAVFGIIAVAPIVSGRRPHLWAAVVAAVMLLLALLAPSWLALLNRVWTWVGMQLHRLVSPVVLGLLFGAFIVIGKLIGDRRYESLGLRFDPTRRSYWVDRVPPGPEPETMRRQF